MSETILAQTRASLRDALQRRQPGRLPAGHPGCVLFFSWCELAERATTFTVTGDDFDAAWHAGELVLSARGWRVGATPSAWLRVDAVTAVQGHAWGQLEQIFSRIKRNYFARGIAFTADFSRALLDIELGANAILYDAAHVACHPNALNLRSYGLRRYGAPLAWPAGEADNIWTFSATAVFADKDGAKVLEDEGRHRGYRRLDPLREADVRDLIHSGTDYLARQVGPAGRYQYGWFPCFDRPIPTYNALRHASSTYALLEGWELTGQAAHKAAAVRALTHLTQTLIRGKRLPDGTDAAFLVDEGEEVKLGGNAVCLLALGKYTDLTGDRQHLPLMGALAEGIVFMQDQATGGFVHVLHFESLEVKAAYRTVYYDGEAAFGLIRLYGLTREERWLRAVENAVDHFIRTDRWQTHDHWLGYCVSELTVHRPQERYFRLGLDNVRDHLDFVSERITTFPTLLELMMATQRLIARLLAFPQWHHLLHGLDIAKFHAALDARARYLLNGHFWPEVAMFFKSPRKIVGSFHIRHHSFRVRIDDVEHYLSGLVAYWKYLQSADQEAPPADRLSTPPGARVIWGGDVNLGRRQHYRARALGDAAVFRLPSFHAADLRVVNLECVLASMGEQGVDKGEGGPFYFRARPEQVRLLMAAGVDVVTTANNHSGDYGPAALMQQARVLDAAGVAHCGSGPDRAQAFSPVFRRAGTLDVAVFSIDFTQPGFAAGVDHPGHAYLPLDEPPVWKAEMARRIREARAQADVVLVAVHWGRDGALRPDAAEAIAGRALIECGADAVLGASRHALEGVEIHQGRPIIHDAGDLLFDTDSDIPRDGGMFRLDLSHRGVEAVDFIPVGLGFGFSREASGIDALRATQIVRVKSALLGTDMTLQPAGRGRVVLHPGDRPARQGPAAPARRYLWDGRNALPEWAPPGLGTVEAVPDPARCPLRRLGPLTLLGWRVTPETLVKRQMIWVETYWCMETAMDEDVRLDIQAVPVRPTRMPAWGRGMDHDPCDWQVPTSRWRPGLIYRDYVGLRPPRAQNWANGDLRIEIGLVPAPVGAEKLVLPFRVSLAMPGKDDPEPAQ